MGIMDLFLSAVTIADALSDKSEYFDVKCNVVEVFKIGDSWQGTARVHGAGSHVSSDSVNYSTTIKLPDESHGSYTERGLLRKELFTWLGNNFSVEGSVPKEALVLNPSENCLSFEGFAKKLGGKWMVTANEYTATNYVSYRLVVSRKKDGKILGHDELDYLFKKPTTAYVTFSSNDK